MATRLARLKVSGLRCLDGMDLTFEPLTALIGANGAGKSSTFQALQFLFAATDLDDRDCSDGVTDNEIAVTATFTNLPAAWEGRLRPWLNADTNLILTRTRVVDGNGRARPRYTATRRQAPGFGPIREAVSNGTSAAELKALWIKAQSGSGGLLPAWPNKPNVLATLAEFEATHPLTLTDTSTDSSIGFGSNFEVDLTEMIELLVLPALRDAADDATDTRGSTLTRLVDLTVRSGMDLEKQLADLSERTSKAYQEIVDQAGGSGLADLAALITGQLNAFAPGSQVQLKWDPRVPALAAPPVRATIIESDHEADVGRQGHGVQRAYVFSLLRALLEVRREDGETRPGLLLAIEEPEVYQHPIRARYVANVLTGLAYATDTSTQVIFTTHSPLFVSVERIESVRQLRLTTPGQQANGTTGEATDAEDETAQLALDIDANLQVRTDGGPATGSAIPAPDETPVQHRPRTRATAPTLAEIAARLETARAGRGQAWTPERVAAQLPGLLGTAVSEGFFADKVVLVEGEEDFGFIHGAAEATGVDLYEHGIAVIPVGGKDRLLLAHEIFHAAAVPTYVVFDTDVTKNDPGALWQNRMISVLAGEAPEEKPATATRATSAPMSPCLRDVIENEVAATTVQAEFDRTLSMMGLGAGAAKNGHVVRAVTLNLYAAGHRSATLGALVTAIAT